MSCFSLPSKAQTGLLILVAALLQTLPFYGEDASPASTAAPAAVSIPQLIIDPSSTKLSLAKANLTVSALDFHEQVYSGSYRIKVTPFAFKNDQGSLLLVVSDENARKMVRGEAVEFTGKAISAKDGKIKAVKGKTKPADGDHGAVSFVVTSEDGDLLFNTSYHFATR